MEERLAVAVTTIKANGVEAASTGQVQTVLSNTGIDRRSFTRIPTVWEMPDLVQIQKESFEWFKREGLRELLEEISPISDHHKKMELTFGDYRFDEPWKRLPEHLQQQGKDDPRIVEQFCRERDITYASPLRIKAKLRVVNPETGEIREIGAGEDEDSEIFIGDFPLMTTDGTFIINGAERVVVSQLVRSPGVYFDRSTDPTTGKLVSTAKLIPNRGAWLEFETSNRDVMSVKVDRKRKMPVTILLRAIGMTDDELDTAFADVDTNPDRPFLRTTLEKDPTREKDEALIELYRRLRPGDPPTRDNATTMLDNLFFNDRRYDLARVGRYKLNERLHREKSDGARPDSRILTREDLIEIIREMIRLGNGLSEPDDIDHLGNRRIRAVGELIQMHVRTGFQRLERGIRERMTIQDPETVTPKGLISTTRPVMAAVREFFGGSQLSQFMDQTNPLAELTHKRRLSALGPGGLSRDRAGFDVRDVHPSHYGRVCPIETPEGPNIGLMLSLATYGKINQYGFIETPYRRVISRLSLEDPVIEPVGQILRDDVVHPESGKELASSGDELTAANVKAMKTAGVRQVRIKPVASPIIDYLSADREEHVSIAQANTPLDENDRIMPEQVVVRVGGGHRFPVIPAGDAQYMDVSPKQVVSVGTALIPFLEHDDANRALMGANMQKQAVPLVQPKAPIIGTGVEHQAAKDSGQVLVSRHSGTITAVTARIV